MPLLDEGLALARDLGDQRLVAYALVTLGGLAQMRGDAERARALREEALTLLRTEEVRETAAELQARLRSAAQRIDAAEAAERYSESLKLYRAVAINRGLLLGLDRFGQYLLFWGDYQGATAVWEEGLALARSMGEGWHWFPLGIAQAALEQGEYDRATALAEEALAVARTVRDKEGIAGALLKLSDVARNQGDTERLSALCEEALALARDLGNKMPIGYALHNLGLAARAHGDYERATALCVEGLSLLDEYWNESSYEVITSLGLIERDQGHDDRAEEYFARSLVLLRADTSCSLWQSYTATALEGVAGVAVVRGQAERAARLFGAADAIRSRIGTPIWPVNRPLYERDVAAARAALGEEAFRMAWEEGRAMTAEQAVEHALHDAR